MRFYFHGTLAAVSRNNSSSLHGARLHISAAKLQSVFFSKQHLSGAACTAQALRAAPTTLTPQGFWADTVVSIPSSLLHNKGSRKKVQASLSHCAVTLIKVMQRTVLGSHEPWPRAHTTCCSLWDDGWMGRAQDTSSEKRELQIFVEQ